MLMNASVLFSQKGMDWHVRMHTGPTPSRTCSREHCCGALSREPSSVTSVAGGREKDGAPSQHAPVRRRPATLC